MRCVNLKGLHLPLVLRLSIAVDSMYGTVKSEIYFSHMECSHAKKICTELFSQPLGSG